MDMVATRDIEIGEEVYLNYGDAWEQQWNEYVSNWKPAPENEGYIPASVLNKQVEWLRTLEELAVDPYPETVFTGCFLDLDDWNHESKELRTIEWKYSQGMFDDAVNVNECVVIARETEAEEHEIENERDSYRPPLVTYTVELPRYYHPHMGPFKVTGVPRTAIDFFDRMYSNDQFMRHTFRHEIGLPDEMLPDAWRDLKAE